MAVRFTTKLVSTWTPETIQKLDGKVAALATRIHRGAIQLSPRLTGALRSSGRIQRNGTGNYSIIFGGGTVRYAKRRHYENRRNPGTLRYLERSGDANSRQFKQELKRV